ncbi:MAG: glycosyltransferase [Gammaproteobacteria bacterium]|nr:glycosyltransferase [Gammaproteobacteria bacterium]
MNSLLATYANVIGEDIVDHLTQLSRPLRGMKVVHVNSTRQGGGVAEILNWLIPLQRELGMEAHWEVIQGQNEFYQCTKQFHNALQGNAAIINQVSLKEYEQTNCQFAEKHGALLQDADVVFIHDPQPAASIKYFPKRKGKWIWRCHVDASHPYRPVWRYLSKIVSDFDASIFSLADFSQMLPHPVYLIPPSIDPLSEKNVELSEDEIRNVCLQHNIDPKRPIMLQVSRFDRFKDPLGVIEAYRLATAFIPTLQLVLAGSGADDDPEGAVVLAEVQTAAREDADIHILLLPPDAHRTINALQRAADFVLQKSLKEGFGLTVAEAMWKAKPVIGGDTGGIRLQIIDHHTGFLVNSPEGAALRIRYLLHHRQHLLEMGAKAREFVRQNFLITRHLREYLTLMVGLVHQAEYSHG